MKENGEIKVKLDRGRERMNKDGNEGRKVTLEEYGVFFWSVDVGDFRNCIMKDFYADVDEVVEYYGE
ncbi:hypothetical protein [Bacillus thuringiensis]|uniref:hypothetical protein n=1 Tax=Bacillus thuringiensis TaxID=1428 RepID=UPI0011A9C057|nr:hypothetical protein [Bacillus thuringiensis]